MVSQAQLDTSVSLLKFISDEGLVASNVEEEKRKDVVDKLKEILMAWVKRVAYQRRLPLNQIKDASVTILLYGSYGLGVYNADSNIDILCVGPCFASIAEDFFIVLHNMLAGRSEVFGIHSVKDAKLLRFTFEGIMIDLSFAKLQVTAVPENVDVSNPLFLKSIDKTSSKNLSGIRLKNSILKLVPDVKAFQELLRCVKLWAKRRGVYSDLFGFFGGTHLAILAALICLKNPSASLLDLISMFFKTFAFWPWPEPVILEEGATPNTPPLTPGAQAWMPIQLPGSRNEYCYSNITTSTFNKIRSEFRRGYRQTQIHPRETVIMSREAMTIGSDKEPPVLFHRNHYSQWKDRFLDFIDRQELSEEMLQSLKEGPAEFYINDDPPLTARQEVVNRSSLSEKQNNRIKADKRAISYLLRGMTDEILAYIDSHETAKGLWDALSELMQGGESSARIEVTKSYEGFKAKDGEFLEVTYNRYCRLLNELRKSGIHKSNREVNLKFVNNLKPEWKLFATHIMQIREPSEFDIHALFRNLNPLIADERQLNSSSSRGLKVNKERAQSHESFVSFVSRRDMAVGYQQPPVLFCRPHFFSWKKRFFFFIRGLRFQELGDEILQSSLLILESLLEGPTELYINADPLSQEVMDRCSLSEKQKNRIKADKVAKSYLRRGLTNEILACIDSYKTATGMWVELSKQMQGTGIGAHIEMEEIGKCYSCGKTDCYVLQEKQHWGSR